MKGVSYEEAGYFPILSVPYKGDRLSLKYFSLLLQRIASWNYTEGVYQTESESQLNSSCVYISQATNLPRGTKEAAERLQEWLH